MAAKGTLDPNRNPFDQPSAPPSISSLANSMIPQRAQASSESELIKSGKPVVVAGYSLTKVGIMRDSAPTEQDWHQLGTYLAGTEDVRAWWWGDYLNESELKWGVTIQQLSDALNRAPNTLYAWLRIAREFDFTRRRVNLSWSHHEAVSALPVEEQEAWLNWASSGERPISIANLREAMRPQPQPVESPPKPARVERFELRISSMVSKNLKRPQAERKLMADTLRTQADLLEKPTKKKG